MLGMIIGWIVVGAVIGAALTVFWDDIAQWLNNTAADAVERVLGYNAKKNMHRAVATISRIREKILNRTVIYAKENEKDSYYKKIMCETDAPVYQIDTEVLEKLEKQGELVNTFEYKNGN